jgi:hypothetical protein
MSFAHPASLTWGWARANGDGERAEQHWPTVKIRWWGGQKKWLRKTTTDIWDTSLTIGIRVYQPHTNSVGDIWLVRGSYWTTWDLHRQAADSRMLY